MSSLKESEEQTSPPATPGSLGVHVANSHFSKTSASSGNNGWLQEGKGGRKRRRGRGGNNTAWVQAAKRLTMHTAKSGPGDVQNIHTHTFTHTFLFKQIKDKWQIRGVVSLSIPSRVKFMLSQFGNLKISIIQSIELVSAFNKIHFTMSSVVQNEHIHTPLVLNDCYF